MKLDWRSDTLTLPTPAMREAMASAPVGDDVFGEDPSINLLEKTLAERFGMEAALYCPSGTMTNQIAMVMHAGAGQEIICDRLCHIYNYEGGGVAATAGASLRLINSERGMFTAQDVLDNINPADAHYTETAAVSLENTSNRGGGACYEMSTMQEIAAVCKEHHLPLHLDGARLYNAIVAKGESPADYGKLFTTISLCLSKGLGAPVGSVLLCSKEDRKRAHRIRKRLGGGMRQAGILAAGALYALEHHVERLAEDHDKAKAVGKVLAEQPYVADVFPVETNIVVANLTSETNRTELLQQWEAQDLHAVPFGPHGIRFVAHLNISDAVLEATLKIIKA